MSRKTRAITSREYKIILQANRFAGTEKEILAAAAEFKNAFGESIGAAGLTSIRDSVDKGSFNRGKDKKQVSVQFFDTKDRRLRNSNFVFRRRQPLHGGRVELTLKRRHPDRFYVSGSTTGRDKKFEEDIKVSQTNNFISLHSLSGKLKKVDEKTEFTTLKDVRDVFKTLKKQLGEKYNSKASLLRVCNFIAKQSVYEGVHFPVAKNLEAECALIVWHQQGSELLSPAVVEFSFRYRDKKLASNQEPFTKEMAKLCFDILQVLRDETSAVAQWVDLDGPTKTAYAYSLTRA